MVIEPPEGEAPLFKSLTDINDRKIVLKDDGEPDIIDDENHPNNGNPKLEFNPNHGQTVLDNYPNIRVLKVKSNALTSLNEIKKLPNLLELQANSNQIASLDCLAEDRETLPYL